MKDAQLLVDRLQLKNTEINGQKLDLNEIMKDHESTGRYRVMVMQAATRLRKFDNFNSHAAPPFV